MLSDEASDLLSVLAKETEKTQKEIIEEALKMFSGKDEIMKQMIVSIF